MRARPLWQKINSMERISGPVALIVLDGWGYRADEKNNAIVAAKKPFYDHLLAIYPHSLLAASGEAVGLPVGQIGNSEVGHMTIGAGTVIDTDLVRINKAIANGEFAQNKVLQVLLSRAKENGGVLHAIGLVGPGGIHAYGDHLFAILRAGKEANIKQVVIHAITDGRDVPPQSAMQYLEELEVAIKKIGIGVIASISGRYYAMDRDQHFERTEKAEAAMFALPEAPRSTKDAVGVLQDSYSIGVTDEHLIPVTLVTGNNETYPIQANDSVILFNFRADRMRMLTSRLLIAAKRDGFMVATMTSYDKELDCPVFFPPVVVTTTLASEIARAGLRQVHIAETEKYAHATYFLNCGRELPYINEERIMIPSRRDVATYDQAPAMSAAEIATTAAKEAAKGTDFIFVNFANADMVGHTGNYAATIQAIEALDASLQVVVEAVQAAGGVVVITADHGNAEINIDPQTGVKHTAHTLSLVPCMVTLAGKKLRDGSLADVAPTILEILQLPKSASMTGQSLLSD